MAATAIHVRAYVRRKREAFAVYHYHVLAIQGAYRGYQSRKYNYNHARRKRYLQEVRTLLKSLDLVRLKLCYIVQRLQFFFTLTLYKRGGGEVQIYGWTNTNANKT